MARRPTVAFNANAPGKVLDALNKGLRRRGHKLMQGHPTLFSGLDVSDPVDGERLRLRLSTHRVYPPRVQRNIELPERWRVAIEWGGSTDRPKYRAVYPFAAVPIDAVLDRLDTWIAAAKVDAEKRRERERARGKWKQLGSEIGSNKVEVEALGNGTGVRISVRLDDEQKIRDVVRAIKFELSRRP